MKHVGKMKNNSARVVVVYRTLPGEPTNCLVVGVQGLTDSYHDTLMSLVETESAQQANELADILAARRFPDGSIMLGYLHSNGHLKKVPTANVLMTPSTQSQIPLDQLNQIIADQKGISIDELAVTDGSEQYAKKPTKDVVPTAPVVEETPAPTGEVSAAQLRSMADKLFKEAQNLRKKAEEMEPTKSKKKVATEAE